jgi:hypothetical protein
LKYSTKDEAEMTFQIDENTEVTVQQHPSQGADRNFKVEFTMQDPDSGEQLRMEIPNPMHNLNAVETLLENFDTQKLIEG